jgi:hypothetical protein
MPGFDPMKSCPAISIATPRNTVTVLGAKKFFILRGSPGPARLTHASPAVRFT